MRQALPFFGVLQRSDNGSKFDDFTALGLMLHQLHNRLSKWGKAFDLIEASHCGISNSLKKGLLIATKEEDDYL